MGEAEAVYKILPDFHFKESSITTVFFPNCPREKRSKFLIRVDDKPQFAHLPTVKIENRDGDYIEKYDIVSKYERRGGLEEICPAQFTKMYEASWKKPKKYQDKYDQNGSNEGERYYHTKVKDSNTRYQQNWDRNSANRDRYATDRLGYAEDTDRYNTVQANNDLSEKETYQYRTPLVPDKVQSLNDRYKGSSDRFEEENGIREGTMFFHKRQIAEPSSDSVSHVSYGR